MISDNKTQHLGTIYRLVEQFELISRTDLAKLSGLAPASITNLTKSLIDNKFILERTVQNNTSRGRPAVGLAVSNFFWQLLCFTLSPDNVEISLCELNGKPIQTKHYPLSSKDYPQLDNYLQTCLNDLFWHSPMETNRILAVSISVVGQINAEHSKITRLGDIPIECAFVETLKTQFDCPILLNEHFQLWLLTESTLGSLINNDNVIFLQLDEAVNLSVLLRGNLLHQQSKMNVDKMLMPKFSSLSDVAAPSDCDEIQRYQLNNQVTFPAIIRLVDRYLPNTFTQHNEKIQYLCEQIEQQNETALMILEHISDNLAYVLMNLINIFSTEKIMLNSPLLRIKHILFEQIQQKLQKELLIGNHQVDLVTSQFEWNSPLIACSAIKQGIYEGNLIKDIIQL
ncbi:ROK family protein [Actinobacillus equuli]|uniref:ROK family protein n=1 Tax=Actinobacillus equuli TaxID=718 RepID=UPI002441168E|nr:ROK family protein [Actinobacillus equuli]WGE53617.1 ROK family protein [Actinobacillus equuli subsp. haemolyticus]WGE70674.1 ROK family protein [Actinobacillus equuli subsp. haemolyticus]WGE74053.1 ROK family protein [Actinobacillus equuli subsp. haemolyticus]